MSDFFLCVWVLSATIYVVLLGIRLNRIEDTMRRHGLGEDIDDR